MNNNIVLKDGKPAFVGMEDKHNPPVNPFVGEGSKMTCPKCGNRVDYLVGNIKQVCEGCYKPEEDHAGKEENEEYDKRLEIV